MKIIVNITPTHFAERITAIISPNFLVWKFCERHCSFPQKFYTRKSGKITAFDVVYKRA